MLMYKTIKMNLNLDQSFLPFDAPDSIDYKAFTFSGGEPHIKILTDLRGVDTVNISHRLNSFNDF